MRTLRLRYPRIRLREARFQSCTLTHPQGDTLLLIFQRGKSLADTQGKVAPELLPECGAPASQPLPSRSYCPRHHLGWRGDGPAWVNPGRHSLIM